MQESDIIENKSDIIYTKELASWRVLLRHAEYKE